MQLKRRVEMNIIENLGIEKCREIVAGIIGSANYWKDGEYYDYNENSIFVFRDGEWNWSSCVPSISIDSIKQAIEKYESEQAEMINYSPNVRVLK